MPYVIKPSKSPEEAQRHEKYDDKDEIIIKNLTSDSRRSARQISHAVGLSTVTVLNRIRRLEKMRVIRGYHTDIDYEKMGYGLIAIIEIVVKNTELGHIAESISKHENVCAIYDLTGATDLLVVAKFRSRSELSAFIKDLEDTNNLKRTMTRVVLNTIKEDFRLM